MSKSILTITKTYIRGNYWLLQGGQPGDCEDYKEERV